MMNRAAQEELFRECARLARIKGMPEDVQAQYETGILKLERRIDELRAACGMTLEAFVRRFAYAMGQVKLDVKALEQVDYSKLWDYAYVAAAAWERGDPDGISDGMNGIRRVLFEAEKGVDSDGREGDTA